MVLKVTAGNKLTKEDPLLRHQGAVYQVTACTVARFTNFKKAYFVSSSVNVIDVRQTQKVRVTHLGMFPEAG